MSTPAQMAEREMRRSAARAEAMLVEASRAITDAHVAHAVSMARELFDSAPWLAKSAQEIGGCLHLRYCDIYALLVQIEGIPNATK